MKLKDLPNDSNVIGLKIKLTDHLQKEYADYSSKGESEVYLVGPLMGDWFISPDSPGTKSRRLYPMPELVNPRDFLECEIIEN